MAFYRPAFVYDCAMKTVADSERLREILDAFVAAHVVDHEQITSARVLRDRDGEFIAVAAEPGRDLDLPQHFSGLRVVVSEREPGYVAAGPLR